MRRSVATVWNVPWRRRRTSARTDLAASPWRRHVSHFRPNPAVSGEKLNGCQTPHSALPWFGTLWLIPISKNETEGVKTPVWYHYVDPCRIAESAWQWQKRTSRKRSKNGGDGGTGVYTREGNTSRVMAA
jgi:hypothetical protein